MVERTRPVVIGGCGIVAAHFLGRTAAFVLGEEAIVLVASDGDPRRVAVHSGAILTSAADSARIITGGDDSKLVLDRCEWGKPHLGK